MSVILAYQTDNEIIVAGDRRACKADGEIVSEDAPKVFQVNEKLCFACAGSSVIASIISKEISKLDATDLRVEDVGEIVDTFYENAKEKDVPGVYMLPSSLIIAGENREGDIKIYAINYRNGISDKKYVSMIIFNPADMSNQECAEIMIKNIRRFGNEFAKYTIKKIAAKSQWVNAKYDLWTINKKNKVSKFLECQDSPL